MMKMETSSRCAKRYSWSSGGTVDDLLYHYYSTSNKLSAVDDPTADTKLGDFTDNNNSGNDFGNDVNGNLVTDLNKGLKGTPDLDLTTGGAITYNFLNLPSVITVKNADGTSKGTITYIYDAAGNKLEKRVIEGTSTQPTKQTITSYLGGFVYENNVLQFFGHEEGRVRWIPVNGVNAFVYDYFLKDHLGNVRMVLTEEQKKDQYPAVTFEDAALANEQLYYENVDVQRTSRPGPFFTNTTNGDEVQLLRKSTTSIGAGKLLKVMAGDKIDTQVDYYIPSQTTDNSTADGVSSVLSSLLNLLNGADAPEALKGSGTTVTSSLNSAPLTDFLKPQGTTVSSTQPKAYLNILFFDEQFMFVQTNSQLIPANVEGTPQQIVRINTDAATAPKNGYVYVYVSNESNNLVYFDNLQITQERGPLLEETHYYPFGLTMAGISSKAALGLENKYKYNGKELQHNEFSDNSGLELYDYGARMQDPQLGRFMTVDPHADNYNSWTPYNYVGNHPINAFDPNGMDWASDKDRNTADDLTKQLNDRKGDLENQSAGLNKTIHKLKGTIAAGGLSEKKLEKLNKKLSGAESELSEVQSMVSDVTSSISEIKEMGDTKDMTFAFNDLGADQGHGFLSTRIDKDKKAGTEKTVTVINYTYGSSDASGKDMYANMTHEAAHGYQFFQGNMTQTPIQRGTNSFTYKSNNQRWALETLA